MEPFRVGKDRLLVYTLHGVLESFRTEPFLSISGGLFHIWRGGGENLMKAKEQGALLMNLYYIY